MSAGRMCREAAEASGVVRTQLDANARQMEAVGAELRRASPRIIVTCGRGSSDHAATFAKYLIEVRAGVLTCSAAPSSSSLYHARTDHRDAVFLAISQSGRSPDLLAAAESARELGARVVVLCNVPESPLAQLAHHVVPLCAGAETSIAATKSYIASLCAIVHLLAAWTEDRSLLASLMRLPDLLEAAWAQDWRAALPVLEPAVNLYVVGRGFGLGVVQEAALKLKETAALHAEAFSAAEVKHGPMTLVGRGFPVLMLSQRDESRACIEQLGLDFAARGADVIAAGAVIPGAVALPTLPAHPVIEPILMIQSFYRMVAELAVARGLDPDAPPHLNKVTETL